MKDKIIEKKLHVFSGECEQGKCGLKSNIIDDNGNELRVGDIVALATKDHNGINCFHGISVVVDDRPGLVGREKKGDPFVMGLFSIDFNSDTTWLIQRVKKYEDVVIGEHWTNYGFNYKEVWSER